jgi:hypothetical protein
MKKLQGSNLNIKAKPATSAAKLAKQLLTKTQRDTLFPKF